jgi:MFS superfamily sulfate permease-like transporter
MASNRADKSPNRLTAAFPILGWLPSHRRAWLGRDAIAGVIVV